MTFEEWFDNADQKRWIDEYDSAKQAWNTALEEAAKVAETSAFDEMSGLAEKIRSLKEE